MLKPFSFFTIFMILMIGCSHGPHHIKEKNYERLVHDESSQAPSFFVLTAQSLDPIQERTPASIVDGPIEDLNDKQLYFFTLWEQKSAFEKLLGISDELRACPAFHHDLITKQSLVEQGQQFSYRKNWNGLAARKALASAPVLSLPLSSGRALYDTYLEKRSIENADVYAALTRFYERTQKEAHELCETGASDGLYIFTNMLRYHREIGSSSSRLSALKAWLKLSPVANFYVLKSLTQGGAMSSYSTSLQSALMRKLKASRFDDYLYKVGRYEQNESDSLFVGR